MIDPVTEVESLGTKILTLALAVLVSLGVGGFLGYHFTKNYLNAQHAAQIAKMNQTSAEKLSQLKSSRTIIETQQAAKAAKAQKDYEDQIATLNGTVAKLRAEHVVLHDPGHPRRHTTRVASSTSHVSSNSGSGQALSPAASDFLFSFAQRADVVRLSLIACQADDSTIRQAVTDYNTQLQKVSAQSDAQAQKSLTH